MADLTAIILTKNEEKNLFDCLNSIKSLAERIVVVDCGSTDKTVEIAREFGADVLVHEWVNYAQQYIWAEKNANIKTKWVFRIDADERLTEESSREIESICSANENTNVNGIVVRFTVSFLGKDLKHGGIYPFKKMVVYKVGKAAIENRNMDEHIVLLEGSYVELKNDSIHRDFKDLSAWIDKHNKYSSREVLDYFESRNKNGNQVKGLNRSARIKRIIKFGIYYKLPIGIRAYIYYLYRYYLKLGFLDGTEGKIFAFLQAYWYRFLVDAKIYEKQKGLEKNA